MKNNLLKKILLAENVILLLATVISTIFYFGNISAGYSILVVGPCVLYPLILLTFLIGLLCKAIKIKSCKSAFILFGINLAVSLTCQIAILYAIAGSLEGF